MENLVIFPFSEYWWFYLIFTGFLLFVLALDLGVFHREAHAVSFKEAGTWCVVWVVLALAYNIALYIYASTTLPLRPELTSIPGFDSALVAKNLALEFLTGYVIEYSLSVDNIFVFVLLFGYFAIPPQYQHRVLFFGIIGALIFRVTFIALGALLMQYKFVTYIFGAFLLFTGLKMMFGQDKKLEPEKNPVIRVVRKILPITNTIESQNFFVRVNGKLHGTPLLVALLAVEATDIIFAVDSVPAIFAITREPLIVFTSNMFAILGLRSLYFLLAGVIEIFHLLKYGLAIVLFFVGLKMTILNELYGGKFPIGYSLGFIIFVLGMSIIFSLITKPKATPEPPPL